MYRTISRIGLAAALAALAAAGLAASASGSRSLSLTPGGSFTATSAGLLSLTIWISGAPLPIVCSAQLTGTLASATPKLSGSHLGTIGAASIAPCSNGSGIPVTVDANALIGTGWRLRYATFAGRLPAPSRVDLTIEPLAFLVDVSGLAACLLVARAGSGSIAFRGSAPNTAGSFTFNRTLMTPTVFLSGSCARPAVAATFSIAPVQTLVLLN